MERENVIARVNELIMTNFEIPAEKLVPEATFSEDLGLDSLDAVDMLVHLESTLEVKVDVEKFKTVKTLGDIYQLVYEMSSDLAK